MPCRHYIKIREMGVWSCIHYSEFSRMTHWHHMEWINSMNERTNERTNEWTRESAREKKNISVGILYLEHYQWLQEVTGSVYLDLLKSSLQYFSFWSIRWLPVCQTRLSHPCNGIISLNKQTSWDLRLFFLSFFSYPHFATHLPNGSVSRCIKTQETRIGLQLVNEREWERKRGGLFILEHMEALWKRFTLPSMGRTGVGCLATHKLGRQAGLPIYIYSTSDSIAKSYYLHIGLNLEVYC